jgi:predicted Zn-dependent protease
LLQGLACARLGQYSKAREALRRAIDLNPGELFATVALVETYVLPTLQVLESDDPPPQLSVLQACIDDLGRASEALRAAKVHDPIQKLVLKQMEGSNFLYQARAYHRIAEERSDVAGMARSANADQRAQELQNESDRALEMARSLQRQGLAALCGVLAETKKHLPTITRKIPRDLLRKHADVAARDLMELCMDGGGDPYWEQVRAAVSGLDDVSPVGVVLATVHEIRTRSFPDARSRRAALLQGCERIDALLEVPSGSPGDRIELLLGRGQLALALKDFDTCERMCKQILDKAPSHPMGRFLRAQTLMGRGDFAQTERTLFVLKTRFPRSAEIAFAYAQAGHAVGKLELALEAMQTVTELDPDHSQARRYVIEKYLVEGYFDQAFDRANEYYHHSPDDPTALRLLVQAAQKTHRLAQGREALDKAVREHPRSPEMLQVAADGYASLGDKPRSIETASAAAQLEPATLEARLAVARALMMIGKTESSESLLTRELTDNGDIPAVRYEMGRREALRGHRQSPSGH